MEVTERLKCHKSINQLKSILNKKLTDLHIQINENLVVVVVFSGVILYCGLMSKARLELGQ